MNRGCLNQRWDSKVVNKLLRGYISVRRPSIFGTTLVAVMVESRKDGNGTGVDRAIAGGQVLRTQPREESPGSAGHDGG
jgi:hypothetical protein